MIDRLAELLRQRALLQEHLTWLDREIAAASAKPGAPPGEPVAPLAVPAPEGALPASPTSTARHAAALQPTAPSPLPSGHAPPPPDADALMEQYRSSTDSLQSDVRKGCFLYFAAAFVLLGVGVGVLYFLLSSR